MDDYRDEIAALNARIEDLERDLADARSTQRSGALRCPHCRREMTIGTVGGRPRMRGHKTEVIDLFFQSRNGGDLKTVDCAVAQDSDGFCEGCSTVVVKGRFAD